MPSSSSSSSSSVSARHQPDGTVDPGAAVAAAAAAVTTSRRQPQTQQPQPQRRYGHETTSVQSDESAGSSSSAFEPSSHSARYTSHVLDIDASDSNDQDNSADDLNFTYGYGGEDELEDDRSLASRRSMDTTEWFQNELSYIPEPKTPRTSTTNNTPGLEGFEVDALRTSTRSSVTSTSASSAKARHTNIWQRPLPAHQVTVNQQVNLMDPRAAKYDEPLSPASSSSSSSGFLQSLYSYNSKTYPEQQRQQQGSNNDNNHQPSNNRFSFLLGSLLLSDDEDEDVYPTQKTTKRKDKKGRLRILVLFGCCLVLLFVVGILFKVLSANLSQNSNAVQEARGEISPPSQLNNIMPTMDTTFSHAYKSLETDSSTTAPKTTTTTVPPRPSQNAPNTKDSANRGSDSDSAGTNRSKKDENLDPSKHQNASTITTPPNMIHPTVMLPVSTRSRAIAAMILEYKVSSPDHLFQSLGNADQKPSASRRALKWICEDDPAQLPLPASYYRNDESDKDGQQDSSSTPTTSSMLLSDDAFLIHQVLQRYSLAVLAFAMLPEESIAEDSKTTIASVGGNEEAAATATANNDAAQANKKRFQQSWLSGDHVCHWRGLDCGTHESRHAPGVERAGVESIHMTSVVSVNLTNHALTGTLPQEIFSSAAMPDLMAVDISHNQIHGGLPSLLDEEDTDDGDASKDNKGRKKIKTSAGHYYVYFTHNDSSIHTVSSRSALRHLELSSNLLTGTIPTSFVSELQNLGILSMERNFLSGTLPEVLNEMNHMVELRLSDNILEGALPESIGHLSSLGKLWLDHNELENSIPSSWEKLTKLELMSLHNNAITGTVPTFVGSMQHLSSLWLQENQFQGNVPSELGKCANLTDLYLDGNFFRGSPPSSLGNLHNLEKLRLYGNRLSGSMPTSICNLMTQHHLEFLSADCKSGHIKCECCNGCF